MKDILRQLVKGIRRDDLPRHARTLIDELLKAHILTPGKILRLSDDYKVGVLDVASNGQGFLEELGERRIIAAHKKGRDLRLSSHALGQAQKGDLVIVYAGHGRFRDGRAKVVFIVQKSVPYTVAYLDKVHGHITALNVKNDTPVTVDAREKALAQLPKHAVLKVDSLSGRITEVLGILSDPRVDEAISLALYDKHEDFPKKAILEAQSYGTQVDKSYYPNRIDLTHLPFCTIDPVTAKDFDDAIYFDLQNLTLYVAIADVTAYVYPFSALDEEAKERGFTIYFPHKSIPMLPRELSENICSLMPDEDRLTYTFKLIFDKETFSVKEFELFEAVIRSQRRYTYDQIDAFIANQWDQASALDHTLWEWIEPLIDITAILRENRLKKGFEFHSTEISLTLNEEGHITQTTREEQTTSHSLIEECMLLANKAAATYFDFGIFRVHPEPKREKIRDLIDNLRALGIEPPKTKDIHELITHIQAQVKDSSMAPHIDKLIIRTQQQATYAAHNIGHFGLGFAYYTHFTSPIRRYSDLILHRLLKSILHKDEKTQRYTLATIEDLTEKISDLERETTRIAWDFDDRKFARWAADNIGKTFKATVTDIDRFGQKDTIAVIDDEIFGARIFIAPRDEHLFESIEVTITHANIATTRIKGTRNDVQKRV